MDRRSNLLKTKFLPLVIVEWGDAWGSAGWRDIQDNHCAEPVVSVGWMVQNDAKGITLLTSVAHKNGSAVGTSFIPKGMVSKLTKMPHKYGMNYNHVS